MLLAVPLLALQVTTASSLPGQEPLAPLSLEVLLTAPRLALVGAPSVAADGSEIAYTVIDNRRKPAVEPKNFVRTGVPWFALGSDVWISSISQGQGRNITEGRGNNWAPSWSPDGRRLAFLSDRVGRSAVNQARLWVWERTSGRLRQVTDVPVMDPSGKLGALEWLADNRRVLVKTYPEGRAPLASDTIVARQPHGEHNPSDTGLTVKLLRFDPASDGPAPRTDPNNLASLLGELALVDVETGAIRRLSGGAQIASYALSPDRRKLAWAVATRFEEPGSPHILAELMVCDLATGTPRRLTAEARLAYGFPNFPLFSWAPTSQAIAYRTDGPGMPDEVYVVPLAGGNPRRVAGGVAHERFLWAEPALWAADGRQLYWVRSDTVWRASVDSDSPSPVATAAGQRLWLIPREAGQLWSPDGRSAMALTRNTATKSAGLVRVDLASGRITRLFEEAKAYSFPARFPVVMPDGKALVYAAESPQAPPNLWLAQAAGRQQPRQVSRVADALARTGRGPAKLLEWRSLDGDTLRGALIYPASFQEGVRYPLIVKVYGGTDLSDDLNRFGLSLSPVDDLHVYASRGYAVLLADSRVEVGTPMRDLLKSVLPGVDRAVEIGVADPARIGLMGHSYGGYSTLALITQSRRFKAAVMRAGFGDLVSAYGQLGADGTNYMLSWAERGQGRMGGTPWEARDRYIENSPIHYLDRVETPLLIVQGMDDIYPFLSDQVFTGLRRLGKRVDYARYLGEGHSESQWNRRNQLDYLVRVVAWFDHYLRPGADPDR